MRRPKVLAIDDEPALLRIIKDSLQENFDVFLAENSREAFVAIVDQKPDLILVDNIMPEINGLDMVRTLRRALATAQIPIIMITALKESVDRIDAFKAGVDDFISKPFNPDELLVRVESKLQRKKTSKELNTKPMNIGNLSINFENQDVRIGGKAIHLTKIELAILGKLTTEKNQIVTRKTLEDLIWPDQAPEGRILDIHMATLRRKTKKFSLKIETVYGKGYSIRG